MRNNPGNQDPKVIKLQEIYHEMDTEDRETMIHAVDNLLSIQKNFKDKNAKVQDLQHLRKRRFMGIAGYIVSGIILISAIWFFWETLLNPALLKIDITPLVMVRIIITAFIGIFCLVSGLVGFLQRWFKALWLFLLIISGIACIDPQILTDFIGFSLIALIITVLFVQKKHQRAVL